MNIRNTIIKAEDKDVFSKSVSRSYRKFVFVLGTVHSVTFSVIRLIIGS